MLIKMGKYIRIKMLRFEEDVASVRGSTPQNEVRGLKCFCI